ncbi:ATP-binding protein [Streptomyces tateyamensis]|uniref:ATP-binding protein n=2 Tax=Streptomyces tateyamensis TaxID=565073 RepID=A0A2V4MUZ0_9ACTN|nr:ATP-binding protein [Streptomyces tateyamensis]
MSAASLTLCMQCLTRGRGVVGQETRAGVRNPPRASALMESLRSFGYDMATALADLVDNSITAGATQVRVEFSTTEGQSWVAIVDNGKGMTEAVLHKALRLGGDGPTALRDRADLGRFGLGLKTASLSQCRLLTVLSRRAGRLTCRSWDLEHVARVDDWEVLTEADADALQIAEEVAFTGTGTMVLWRHLDNAGEGKVLAQRIGQARVRLAMWFHRFLAAGTLDLRVGPRSVRAWDPFWRKWMATQDLGTEFLGPQGAVKVTPFVLPHPARLSNQELDLAAGPRGWNAQQGFYVYRRNRLVSAGGWLGLPDLTNTHQTRLARIEVDIDQKADSAWQVDVRKSRVHAPPGLEADLTRLACAAREASVRAFRQRAVTLTRARGAEITFGWLPRQRGGAIDYVVNRQHPVVQAALEAPGRATVEALLRLVERTVPVGLIAIEAERDETRTPQAALEHDDENVVRAELTAMLVGLPKDPVARDRLVRALASVEPFNRFPALVAELTSEVSTDGDGR